MYSIFFKIAFVFWPFFFDSSNLLWSLRWSRRLRCLGNRFAWVSVGCAYEYSNWWYMKLCRRCRAKNEIISRQNIKVYCSLAFRSVFFCFWFLFLFLLLLFIVNLVVRRICYRTCLINKRVSMIPVYVVLVIWCWISSSESLSLES